jgi:(2S)-methylsuccinyl-CoA dehydrogenase
MKHNAENSQSSASQLRLPNLLETCGRALEAALAYRTAAREALAALVAPDGKVDAARLESQQFAAHGFAWLATYVAALEQALDWARRLDADGGLGELEALQLQAAFGEYLQQLIGGIALSQVEVFRPADLGLDAPVAVLRSDPGAAALIDASGNAVRMRIAALLRDAEGSGQFGDPAFDAETLELVRDQFRKVADEHIEAAHRWHLDDALIPLEVIEQLAQLGIFGLTVPEDYGGLGMGKIAMCVVTEELSRGYIGLGSLGTRSEIAAELIRLGGTEEQKTRWLPRIASGEILPTAVFTEPSTGSDLGALKTRAVREGEVYRITGNKTWITHAARADMMNRGPGLSRHEGIRDRIRRFRGQGGKPPRRCRGSGLQAAHGDLRVGACADRRAGRGRGAIRP